MEKEIKIPEETLLISPELEKIIDYSSLVEKTNKMQCKIILNREDVSPILEVCEYHSRPKMLSCICSEQLAFLFIENDKLLKNIEITFNNEIKLIQFTRLCIKVKKFDNNSYILTFSDFWG